MDLAIIVFTSLEGRAPSVSGKDAITKRTPGALSPGKSACGEESGGSPKLRHKLRQVGDDLVHPRKAKTRSRSPAMYSAGTVTCTPETGAKSSQFRSMLRYQFSAPRNPVRANSLM